MNINVSELIEDGFLVSFNFNVENFDCFTLRSDYIESDPMHHVQELIEYLNHIGKNFVSLSVYFDTIDELEVVVLKNNTRHLTYTEHELRDTCVAEVFVGNVYSLITDDIF